MIKILFLIALLTASNRGSTPDIVYSRDPGAPPIWVSESRLVSRGQPDWTLVGDNVRRNFDAVQRNHLRTVQPPTADSSDASKLGDAHEPLASCIPWGRSYRNYAVNFPDASFDDLLANGRNAAVGQIIALVAGVFDGEPATLITLRVEQFVGADRNTANTRELYIVYPRAVLRFDDRLFCKFDDRFPHSPSIGERVMFFTYQPPWNAEGTLFLAEKRKTFFETASSIVAPAGLEGLPGALPRRFFGTAIQEFGTAKGSRVDKRLP